MTAISSSTNPRRWPLARIGFDRVRQRPVLLYPEGAMFINESGKAILEKHCSAMTSDPRFKGAMGMTLKQVRPMSQGKITQEIYDAVAKELELLPKAGCKKCGEALAAA